MSIRKGTIISLWGRNQKNKLLSAKISSEKIKYTKKIKKKQKYFLSIVKVLGVEEFSKKSWKKIRKFNLELKLYF